MWDGQRRLWIAAYDEFLASGSKDDLTVSGCLDMLRAAADLLRPTDGS